MLLSAVLTSNRCVSMPFIFGPGTGGRIKAIILKQTNKQTEINKTNRKESNQTNGQKKQQNKYK